MKTTIEFLRKKEWSMGNGQCPDCCGLGVTFEKQSDAKDIGHKKNCTRAKALRELGEKPLMKGKYVPEFEWEDFLTENGIFGRRHKTPDGCPKYKQWAIKDSERWKKLFEEIYADDAK